MTRCERCKHYTPLTEPRMANEENYIHGFCFKDYKGRHGITYPVYLPDGGICKSFVKRKVIDEGEQAVAGQMSLATNFPEVLS